MHYCVLVERNYIKNGDFWCWRCNWILGNDGRIENFSAKNQEQMIEDVIEPMASNGMRTICIAYRDFVTTSQYIYL